jgi:hypothetical protein
VIRSASGERREGGVRHGGIPSRVDERSVNTFQSWFDSLVRPGVATVQQRQFNEAYRVDIFIEGCSFRSAEVAVVLILRVSDHVEVADDHPRNVRVGGNGSELVQEVWPAFGAGRSVDISDGEGEAGGGRRKGDGKGVRGGVSGGGVQHRAIPRSDNPSSSADGGDEGDLVQAPGEEGEALMKGNIWELGFLEKHNVRGNRDHFSKHRSTFDRIIQTSHIPVTQLDASIHSIRELHHTLDGASKQPSTIFTLFSQQQTLLLTGVSTGR